MKTFVLKVSLTQESDGRWSAVVPALPGCSSWGYTAQEALHNIKDAAEIFIEDMVDAGQELPHESSNVELINEPAVAVSL